MKFKKMVVEWEMDDGEESEIIVVPDHVTARQVMTDEDHDCFCTCYSDDGADLIVKLLNKHFGEH